MHKKENNAFKFLKAIVFIYYACRIQKGRKKKVLRNLFINVTDQTGVREAIIALGFLSRKIIGCLGFYFELPVVD